MLTHIEYRLHNGDGVVTSGTQSARGEFEFDTGHTVYVAEEWVNPGSRLRLTAGDQVRIAVEKKLLLLQLPGTSVRKLKLLSAHPRTKQ